MVGPILYGQINCLCNCKGCTKCFRAIEFAKNVFEFLLQQDWYSADDSGNTALGSEKISTVSGVSKSIPEHSHEVSQPDSFRNWP